MQIPANQKRILSVTARKVEESLNEMESILNGEKNNNLTEEIIPTLPDNKKAEIIPIIKELREENEKFFNEFSLKPQKLYEDRLIKAQSSYLWTILIDSKSKQLKNYGKVPEDAQEAIDSRINNLLNALEKLTRVLNTP